MRRLKNFICLIFLLTAAVFLVQKWSKTVSAESNQAVNNTLSAPNGFSASDGDYIDKVGLMWNPVRGASLYRVFRNTFNDASTATVVATTAGNYYFDLSAVAEQNYFYWVRAENNSSNSNLSDGDQGYRTVGSFSDPNFSPLPPPPEPVANPVTATKAYLGKTLFWDEQLSSTWTVACGTCHRPDAGGSDPRIFAGNPRSVNPGFDNVFNTPDDVFSSPGVPLNNQDGTYSPSNNFGFNEQVTPRKTPSYLNAGVATSGLFWDGRASNIFRDPISGTTLLTDWGSLETQTVSPPLSDVEMAHGNRNWTQTAEQIATAKPLALAGDIPLPLAAWINNRTYPQLFEEAFGTPEVTPARIALAIGTHERTLFSDRTPFDRWSSSIEPLTASEQRGAGVFRQSCNFCHSGPLLTNQIFHYIGVRPQDEDRGREQVSGNAIDRGRFKTPGLRNVELRAPYMHNGRLATLEDVVEFYNRGGDFSAPNKDARIRPLNLTVQQRADLVAFLKRPLTDPRVAAELPPFDRPRLYTESNRVPVSVGTGRAGTGGIIPQAIAIEPPIVGNPSFTVGVSNAFGNAQAILVIDSNDPGVGSSIPANGAFARVSATVSGQGFASVSLPIPNNPALIGQTFFGRWYVPDAGAANGFSVSQPFRFTVFGAASTSRKTFADFDGDGKTDVSVFRPNAGDWYFLNSSNNSFSAANFGISTDVLTPADFDGDGKTDIAVFRNGAWYLLQSQNGFAAVEFGSTGDKPLPADFDGDGKADFAVFRPSNGVWYFLKSREGFSAVQFGISTDKLLTADFDGDGRADIAVYRDGNWYLLRSRDGFAAVSFGVSTDKPVAADYTGDGKADITVYRPSNGYWYFLRSENGSFGAVNFGVSTDIPAPGDYDGDGKTDFAVFRAGNWYILNSGNSAVRAQNWGIAQDFPVPAAIVP